MPIKRINRHIKNSSSIREKTEPIDESSINIKEKNNKSSNFYIENPKYSFEDIILPENILSSMKDVIYSKKYNKKVFDEWGLSKVLPNSGNKLAVNLYGPPGTGKTMAAHVIANELGKKLLCVNYADIESKYVGETAKNLENAFKFAKENDLVLFFDEADAMLSKRVSNMNNSTDVSVNQTRSVLLMLMNDYKEIIIFATNFINNFDEAFMRRIHFHIKFELPNEEIREILWRRYIPKDMPNNANIKELAKNYENVSGSDISNAVMTAALKAARLEKAYVENQYFHESIKNIIDSKEENKGNSNVTISERFVSEGYAKSQLNIEGRSNK